MPYEWLTKLEQLALQLDAESIVELLKQIPQEYNSLSQLLQTKVDNFDFEEIVDSVQKTVNEIRKIDNQ